MNKKIIILEIIPTNIKSKGGSIIQLSALKLNDLKLEDRFDYRINYNKLPILEMKDWINYDNDQFKYVDLESEILDNFKLFSKGYDLYIIDNNYTRDYISHLDNNIYDILPLFDIEYSDNCIEEIMNKYNLEPSNHIVDLLYEALMMK